MTDVRSLENLSGEILVPLVSRGCCYEEEEAIVALLIVLCWMHVRPGRGKARAPIPIPQSRNSQETLVLQLSVCLKLSFVDNLVQDNNSLPLPRSMVVPGTVLHGRTAGVTAFV